MGRWRLGMVIFATGVAACAPSVSSQSTGPDAAFPTPRDATPDATPDAGADAAPALCYEPSVSGQVTQGTADIQDCAIWNSLAQMTGDVTLSRDSTSLTMAFASGIVFMGTVTDRDVVLTHSTLHEFDDGCEWRATETLSGDLDPTTCVMMLAYQYVETVEISNGACATPCSGTSSLTLEITPIE